nr:site-specific integrase [uncultured Carboxylicivirga sp.]
MEIVNMGVSTSIVLEKRKTLKNKKHPVKLRVIYERKAKYYTLKGESCDTTEFEAIYNPKARGENKKRRQRFDLVEKRAVDIIERFDIFSFDEFEREYLGKRVKDRTIKAYFDNKADELDELGKVQTATGYRATYTSLLKFDKNISFDKITPKYLKQYENWFVTEGKTIQKKAAKDKENPKKGGTYTTVGIYMRNLRHIVNLAIKDKTMVNYPFGEGKSNYQIPVSNNIKKALTIEDIAKLFQYETDSEQERISLEYWLFSYLCNGMNFVDMLNLKYANISGDSLTFIRQKTKDTSKHKTQIEVILLSQVQEIIKELGNKDRSPENFIFPILKPGLSPHESKKLVAQHIQTTNKYMKRIASKVGIDASITTYYARHSYSTIIRDSGASTEFIAEQLGHQSTKVTQSYLDGFKQETKAKFQQHLIPNNK